MTDTPSTTPIQIDIVSDIVCPWCWLGWRYLKDAVSQTSQPIDIRWRAYMLDANVPKDGVDYKDYMKKKFGAQPDNRFAQMRRHLEAAAPAAGIEFRFDGIPKRANTLTAHQLMRWAQGQGRANEMAEALFRAFFTDHQDINSLETLENLAARIDMDSNIIKDLFAKNADEDAVLSEIASVSRAGIRSVPSYIYQGQYLVQGAQPAKAHLNMIDTLSSGENTL